MSDRAQVGELYRDVRLRTTELLTTWAEIAPDFEAGVSAARVWPAFFDVLSHEHDLRHALGTPDGHDTDQVRLAAKLLVRSAELGRPLQVDTGDVLLSSADPGVDEPITLRASAFEVFRLRLGRRSRAQVLALDWSEDPTDLIDALFVFGPDPGQPRARRTLRSADAALRRTGRSAPGCRRGRST